MNIEIPPNVYILDNFPPFVFTFIDVETTGLSVADGNKICEIAILKCDGKSEPVVWQTLVNPLRPISLDASRVNKITDKMVANAPTFNSIAPKIIELVSGTIMVFHNARFDLSFISSELEKCGLSLPDVPVFDTLKAARQHFNFPSNSLGNIANYLEIKQSQYHRALSDVITTYEIFKYLIVELERKNILVNQLTKSCLTF